MGGWCQAANWGKPWSLSAEPVFHACLLCAGGGQHIYTFALGLWIAPHAGIIQTPISGTKSNLVTRVTTLRTYVTFLSQLLDLHYRDVTISSPNPGLAFMLMANEAQLTRLENEIDSKDNFSEVIARAIGQHV